MNDFDWAGFWAAVTDFVVAWRIPVTVVAVILGAIALRWVLQFLASRRAGKPTIPRAFWYMSLVGSVMTLSYFVFSPKQDAVGVLQNLFPAFTAAYSLYLDIRVHRRHDRAGRQGRQAPGEAGARDRLSD